MNRKPNSAAGWPQQVRFNLEFAKRMLLQTGEVLPMFVVHTADDKMLPIGVQMGTGRQKDILAAFLSCVCVAENAVALSHISEAWVRTVKRYDRETKAEYDARVSIPPSESEDRREIILAETTWRDALGKRHTALETREIERGADGKPCGVKPFVDGLDESEATSSYEGRWIDVLPEKPSTPFDQAAARVMLKTIEEKFGLSLKGVG